MKKTTTDKQKISFAIQGLIWSIYSIYVIIDIFSRTEEKNIHVGQSLILSIGCFMIFLQFQKVFEKKDNVNWIIWGCIWLLNTLLWYIF